MRALVYEAPRVMRLRDVEAPEPRHDEVVVRVAYAGICGSELSGFLGSNSLRTPPQVFGHELSGHVVALGEGTRATTRPALGDRVTANPLVTCGRCRDCLSGEQQRCATRRLLGASLPGCNAEFVAVPARCVVPLPDALSLRDATLAEPAACALHAVRTAGADPMSTALVVGAGTIGLLLLQVLAEHGVRTRFVADLNPARLQLAADMGATPVGPDVVAEVLHATGGAGVDVAFDAVGAQDTRSSCVRGVRGGGRVVLAGLHEDATELPLNTVVRNEVSLIGSFAYRAVDFHDAVHLLAAGRLGLADGVVVAPLEDGPDWYQRLVAGDAAAKVLLRPEDDG
jgi:2-desacetyl-2-hydroxyethyl bacteriochlorophyllide A dehydrogenase